MLVQRDLSKWKVCAAMRYHARLAGRREFPHRKVSSRNPQVSHAPRKG
jgi:hypothetical protein